MKTKQLLIVAVIGLGLMSRNASANITYVNFIEGAEGTLVGISSGGWLSSASGAIGTESASFDGFLSPTAFPNFTAGSFNFGLAEPGTPAGAAPVPSDYVTVTWSLVNYPGVGNLLDFHFQFISDTEGSTLPIPSAGTIPDVIQLETGALQTSSIGSFSISVGIQSDLDPVSTPDSGMTIALLGMALGGLGFLRSQLQRNQPPRLIVP
jgi:hypothetical protein